MDCDYLVRWRSYLAYTPCHRQHRCGKAQSCISDIGFGRAAVRCKPAWQSIESFAALQGVRLQRSSWSSGDRMATAIHPNPSGEPLEVACGAA